MAVTQKDIKSTPEVYNFESCLQHRLEDFREAKQTYSGIRIPSRRPPSLMNSAEGWVDRARHEKQIETYSKMWKDSGRDPAVLKIILDKMALVTPPLEKEFQKFIEGNIDEIAKSNDLPIILHGSGGRGEQKTLSYDLQENLKLKYGKLVRFVLKPTTPKYIPHMASLNDPVSYEKGVNIVFVDDWSFSGNKAEYALSNLFWDIPRLRERIKGKVHNHQIIGGITARAIQTLRGNENLHCIYGIPQMCDLFTEEEYERILREICKGVDEKRIDEGMYSGLEKKGLTISHDRIPDSFCFPAIFSGVVGVGLHMPDGTPLPPMVSYYSEDRLAKPITHY